MRNFILLYFTVFVVIACGKNQNTFFDSHNAADAKPAFDLATLESDNACRTWTKGYEVLATEEHTMVFKKNVGPKATFLAPACEDKENSDDFERWFTIDGDSEYVKKRCTKRDVFKNCTRYKYYYEKTCRYEKRLADMKDEVPEGCTGG